MNRFRTWYANLPDPVKAGASTAAVVFLGIFVPALMGWLTDVQSWLADLGGNAPAARPFPDPAILTKAAFAAASAAFIGVINWAWRYAQTKLSWIPGSGPHYEDATGAIELRASGGAGPRHLVSPDPFPETHGRLR